MATIWTQADIDTLRESIASGVLSVSYAGPPSRSVTYHSLAEMRSLLAEMVRSMSGKGSTRYAAFSRGIR